MLSSPKELGHQHTVGMVSLEILFCVYMCSYCTAYIIVLAFFEIAKTSFQKFSPIVLKGDQNGKKVGERPHEINCLYRNYETENCIT